MKRQRLATFWTPILSQRLRYIHQLHSLGIAELAGRVFDVVTQPEPVDDRMLPAGFDRETMAAVYSGGAPPIISLARRDNRGSSVIHHKKVWVSSSALISQTTPEQSLKVVHQNQEQW
jgi:hypothetical protein